MIKSIVSVTTEWSRAILNCACKLCYRLRLDSESVIVINVPLFLKICPAVCTLRASASDDACPKKSGILFNWSYNCKDLKNRLLTFGMLCLILVRVLQTSSAALSIQIRWHGTESRVQTRTGLLFLQSFWITNH